VKLIFLNLNMETTTIKDELKQMIEMEDDPEVLQSIKDLLTNLPIDPILRDKLMSRAYKSLEDIKAGRVHTTEEVIRRTNHLVRR
jgi:hypothetical protein